jgi:hypothetical protein
MSETDGHLTLDPSGALARLLEKIEHIDRVVTRLERLADRADDLEKLARLLDQAPGAVALLADVFDEWSAGVAAQGIDPEAGVKQGLYAALWLGQQISVRELERFGLFLRSEVLEPNVLAVIAKTGRALAASHAEGCPDAAPERLGPVGLLRALSDPDVQRCLGFAVRVAKCFGSRLDEPPDLPTRPMGTTFPRPVEG